jgi:RpiB/LacA/LacB family sugar-phosphate isomerase
MTKKIFIAADHRGVELKAKIVQFVGSLGLEAVDLGSQDAETPCDYPKYSLALGRKVAGTKGARGILVCMTGIGHSIAANKVRGVYAALCYNRDAAVLSRQHNNANVLVLGARFVGEKEMFGIIKAWLAAEFEGGRHLRRVKQIKGIEQQTMK